MTKDESDLQPLELALLEAMRSLDAQIAREMQRTPAERERHGVLKWEPLNKRVERITAFVLNCLGEGDAQLDSVVVIAQAFTKALRMACEDLGEDGLGKVRTGYCLAAFEALSSDAEKGSALLSHTAELS